MQENVSFQSAAAGGNTTDFLSYAGFWKRFAAYIIDAVILFIAVSIITLGGTLRHSISSAFFSNLVYLFAGWVYFAYLESSAWQATVGKRVLQLRVTDVTGGRISFGQATGRYFAKFLSAIILLIGFIMAAFTAKKQALHDIVASTYVLAVVQGPSATVS